MADIILHSGSFCDRNNNEISITFFKRSSTPVMTVEPSSLSYIAAGETKTLTVSGYTGTLSIDVPAAWLSYTQSTSSGVRTYRLTATQNSTATVRRTTITLTDSNNNPIYVEAVQAGTASSIVINPSYITLDATGGQTVTSSLSWSGGTAPTYTGKAAWVNLTTTTSGNTMTLTVSALDNTGEDRTNDIVFSNGTASATLHITQNAASVIYVSPNMLSYAAEGELLQVTVYWTGDVTPTYTINYGSGSGWLSQNGDPVSGNHELTFSFRADANSGTSIRNATIVFTTGNVSASVDVTQAGTVPATISVDKAVIDFTASVGTDTVTVTYSGQGYVSASGGTSWLDVTYKDQPTPTTVRFDVIIDQNTGSARSATITFTGSLGGTATTVVNQAAPAVAWTVSPSTINNVAYSGGTYNLTFTGTPSIGMGYEVDPYTADWVSANIQSLSAATVTVGANATTSQRSATVKFYKYDDHNTYLSVPVSQDGSSVAALSVLPVSMSFISEGERKNAVVENIVGTLTTTKPSWITLSMSGEGGSRTVGVTAASNTLSTSRGGSVIFDDDRQSPVSMAVSQEGVSPTPAMTVSPSTIDLSYRGVYYQNVSLSNFGNHITSSKSSNWLNSYYLVEGVYNIEIYRNNTSSSRTGTITYTDNDNGNTAVLTVTQGINNVSEPLTTSVSSVTFNASDGSGGVWVSTPFTLYNVDRPYNWNTSEDWCRIGTVRDIDETTKEMRIICTSSNSSASARTATGQITDYRNIPVSIAITQLGTEQHAITVNPSTINLNAAGTAVNMSVDYEGTLLVNDNANWLNLSLMISSTGHNQYAVFASSNTSTSERTAQIELEDDYNTVFVPVTQAGRVSPALTVSPTSILANSSLSTYNVTITYPSEYLVWGTVQYIRQPGEPEVNWLTINYSDRRNVDVIVEGNNSGSGRAAQILFEGEAGGTATVDVYQPSN